MLGRQKAIPFAGAACWARSKKGSEPHHTVQEMEKLLISLCVVQQVIQWGSNEPLQWRELQLNSQFSSFLSLMEPVYDAAPVGWRSTLNLWGKKEQLTATSLGYYGAELPDGCTGGVWYLSANWWCCLPKHICLTVSDACAPRLCDKDRVSVIKFLGISSTCKTWVLKRFQGMGWREWEKWVWLYCVQLFRKTNTTHNRKNRHVHICCKLLKHICLD